MIQDQKKLDAMKRKYLRAKNAYYNDDSSGMTDAEYDRLEDKIRVLDPKWAELKATGVPVANKKTEVALREFMPSLNKAYPEAIGKWVAKNEATDYLVTDKLDGASIQIVYNKGKLEQVVTRGNGIMGGDITFLAPHLSIPKTIKSKSLTIFRCEAVVSKVKFAKHWDKEFDTARNMVSGLLNRKKPHAAMSHIDFVVLGCYGLSLRAGLNLAKLEGFATVYQTGISDRQATGAGFTELLNIRLEKSKYEMDGLVIAPYDFVFAYKNADKPKGTIAFKVNADADSVEAKVKKIIWQVSGRGRIIPKIEIEPTTIGGVKVTYCTAHNAKWMQDRGIGPGALVKLVRSGGVIPKIIGVTKKGKYQAPDIAHKVQGVHFVVAQANSATDRLMAVERIVKFVNTLGIDHLAAKSAAKAFSKLQSPQDYVAAFADDTLTETLVSSGIGVAMAEKIASEFFKVLSVKVPIIKMIVASQCFGVGIGERKIKMIEDAKVSLVTFTDSKHQQTLLKALPAVHGFSDKSVALIRDGLADWYAFADFLECNSIQLATVKPKKVTKSGSLNGEVVSFTGYRSKEQETVIADNGGLILPFGSRTTILLVKDGGKASSKGDKARDKGIRVCSFADLKL